MLARDTKMLHVILQEWSDEYNKTQTVKVNWLLAYKKHSLLTPFVIIERV